MKSKVILYSLRSAALLLCALALAACRLEPVTPTMTLGPIKKLTFAWEETGDAWLHGLLENPDGQSGFSAVGGWAYRGDLGTTHTIPLYARNNAQYIVQSCYLYYCVDSEPVSFNFTQEQVTEAIGYIKADDAGNHDEFGKAVSLSADGTIMAVGVPAKDISEDATSGESVESAGAVYVFALRNGHWIQQTSLRASNPGRKDYFGSSVSLSADGTSLAVGAQGEGSNSPGVDGDESNDAAYSAGATYMFSRDASDDWSQQAYIKSSYPRFATLFGYSVSLSADGTSLAVGAPLEHSDATGVDGDQSADNARGAGAVYMYTRNTASLPCTDGKSWCQQAYIKAAYNIRPGFKYFGNSVSLNADGTTLAVGARKDSSDATGVNGDGSNNGLLHSGAAYVFARSTASAPCADGKSWCQQAYLKARDQGKNSFFGHSTSLSADGNTLVVSASEGRSINIFTRDIQANWSLEYFVRGTDKPSTCSLSLSADGNLLAIGGCEEQYGRSGIRSDTSGWQGMVYSGGVYLFARDTASSPCTHGRPWCRMVFIRSIDPDTEDYFGTSVSLSGDGNTLAVGASGEDGSSRGMGGDPFDNSGDKVGAVYLF